MAGIAVRKLGAIGDIHAEDAHLGFAIVDFEERGVHFYGTCDGEAVEGAKDRSA